MRHRWTKMRPLHAMLLHRDAGLAEILPGIGTCRGLPGCEILCAGLAAVHLAQGLNGWNPARSFLRGMPGGWDRNRRGLAPKRWITRKAEARLRASALPIRKRGC